MNNTTNMTLELTDVDAFRQKICTNLGLSTDSDVDEYVDDDVLISLLTVENIGFTIDNNVSTQIYKMTDASVSKLFRNTNNMECCLCIEVFDVGCDVLRLACGHSFHPACIERSVKYKNSCPMCRSKIRVYKLPDEVEVVDEVVP